MALCQNPVPLVNIKIAGKWMFIPLKMVLIGIDPYPDGNLWFQNKLCTKIHRSRYFVTKGGADVMAFVVGGKFSMEDGLELKSARWQFVWDFLQFFCDFLNFGMNLPRFFNFWDVFFWLLEMFIDFLVCVWPGFTRSFQFLGWSLLVLGDFSNFEHLHLVSRLGNYLK